jgi:hypothetical protein
MTIKGIYRCIRNCFFPKGHNEIVKKIAKLQRGIPPLEKQVKNYEGWMSIGATLNDATFDDYWRLKTAVDYYKDQLSLLKKQYKQYYCK